MSSEGQRALAAGLAREDIGSPCAELDRRLSPRGGPAVRHARRLLERVGKVVDWSLRAILVVVHAFLLGVVVMGVFYRYVLDDPIAWSDTVSGWLFAAMVMLAAVIGVRRKTHIMIDVLYTKVPPSLRLVLDSVYFAGFVMVGVILVYSGIKLGQLMGDRKSLTVDVTMGVPMAVIPIGGAMFVLEGLRGLAELAIGLKPIVADDAESSASAGLM